MALQHPSTALRVTVRLSAVEGWFHELNNIKTVLQTNQY